MRRLFIMSELDLHKPVKVGEHHKDGVKEHDIFYPLWATAHMQIGAHWIDLIEYESQENAELKSASVDIEAMRLIGSGGSAGPTRIHAPEWEDLPEVKAWRDAGSLVLLSTSLSHSEWVEDLWMQHPGIAVLPHPQREGNVKLVERKDQELRITQRHLDALGKHRVKTTGKGLGFSPNDTLRTLAAKAEAIHPQVRLGNML